MKNVVKQSSIGIGISGERKLRESEKRRETRLTPQGGGNKNDTKCKFTFLQKHLHFRAMRRKDI
jgi:hypothetical protein